MENIEIDANAAMNLANANHDEKVRQKEDGEAMNLGNSNYENLAAKIKKNSMDKAEIEAIRRQKKCSRRAFLIGALTGMGGLAAGLALHEKAESNKDKNNMEVKKEQMIDEAYDSVKEELYKKLLVQTPSEFKFELSDTTLNGYSDYLIYRLAEEHEMTNAGKYEYYAECTNAVILYRAKIYNNYYSQNTEDNDLENDLKNDLEKAQLVSDDMIYSSINADDFKQKIELYKKQEVQKQQGQQLEEESQSKGAAR